MPDEQSTTSCGRKIKKPEEENTLNKDKETLKSGKEKFQQELKLLENRSVVFKKNIEQSKEKIRIARSNAEKSGECIDSGRSIEEIKLLIKETEKVIETQSNCDREGLSRRYVEKLENINRAEQELKKIERYLMRIDGMIKFRRSKFYLIKRQTEITIDMAFIAICSGNGYKGRLEINSTKRTLALIVDPRSGNSGRKNQSSLSGGERSFVMIAFLLALWQRTKIPFRILDEYDVFMDSNNRQLSVDLLKKKSEEMAETQFVYLSPLDLPRIQESDFIQIIRLAAPKRKNEVFSNKSLFQLCPDNHQGCVWRHPVQFANPAFTIAQALNHELWFRVPFLLIVGPLWSSFRSTLTAQQCVDHIRKTLATVPFAVCWPYFSEDKTRPHAARVAMNCLTVSQTLPWPARPLFNRVCLGYDGKATASTREC
ncbi:structural maintenance of chromosomes protein 6 [Trichonephila clavipes]|nr:structural maintenance of chromosomes protein 6 [Trichonephila clavipes]